VPPNWLNWKRGLKERIRSRTDWKERASLAARVARAKSGWLLPKNSDHRSVAIRCFRVRQLDHDGLHASVKPIIDGLKYVQYVRLGKRGTRYVQVEGAGLIYDDGPRFVTVSVSQHPVEHFADEKTEIEVSRESI